VKTLRFVAPLVRIRNEAVWVLTALDNGGRMFAETVRSFERIIFEHFVNISRPTLARCGQR